MDGWLHSIAMASANGNGDLSRQRVGSLVLFVVAHEQVSIARAERSA